MERKHLLGITTNLCRFVIAAAFIFSGITKVIDPHGTEYKLQDYAEAFHLGALMPSTVALVLAVLLAIFEFRVGFCALFGIYRRFNSRAALAFMLVFTPLTLYLAIADPVSDCGCFGDAWVLSNWQTFGKNVVLLLCALVLVKWYRLQFRIISESRQWIVLMYAQLFALGLAVYALWRLPLLDFRPYSIGSDIAAEMQVEGDVEYVTSFLMEKDGQQEWFSLEEYPDSTWTFVDSKTETKGDFKPAVIDNLQMYAWPEGDDLTEDVLADEGYTFLLTIPSIEDADDGHMDAYNRIYEFAEAHGYRFLCLTSSNDEAIVRWQDLTGAEYPFCHTDVLTLKTMVRSNPGLLLLKKGVVVNKWPYTEMPDLDSNSPRLEDSPMGKMQESARTKQTAKLVLWFVIPLIIVTFLDRIWYGIQVLLRRRKRAHVQTNDAEQNEGIEDMPASTGETAEMAEGTSDASEDMNAEG